MALYSKKAKVVVRPYCDDNAVDQSLEDIPIPLAPPFYGLIKMKGEIGALFFEYITTKAQTSLYIYPYASGFAPWEI
jgi:hypothetical protein